jgi:hypothetical protein
MLIKEVKNKLFESLRKPFEENGFLLNKADNAYERKNKESIQKFYFLVFKKDDSIYLEPRWSIKLPEILEMYHKVAMKDKKFFRDTPVLENSLGELIEYTDSGNHTGSGKSMQYLIENEEDLAILMRVIPKRFKEYVLPYFDANSTIERVDKILNENPRELSIHQWLYPLRACMGLIAARLVNNPMYDDLARIYKEELQDATTTYKLEFERLTKLLSKHYVSK